MKYLFTLIAYFFFSTYSIAQYNYEPTKDHPFGQLNPAATSETGDFSPLIGESVCTSQNRASDGSWLKKVDTIWRWKYIMNGMAVQDETLKADGTHSGSIRQFNADSTKWYVHYYSAASAVASLPVWEGTKTTKNKIVLYRQQSGPNGMDGYYRLTFFDITDKSFEWIGEWVNPDETIVYPTWKISCVKSN
jgi:hypothetical protein